MARSRRRIYGLLVFIGISTPLTLLVEYGLRRLLFPPEANEIREWLRPSITPWVWLAVPASLLAIPIGWKIGGSYGDRNLRRLPEHERTPDKIEKYRFDAMMLSTSAPQIPALAATLSFMAGAELTPVITAIVVATVGVVIVGSVQLRKLREG